METKELTEKQKERRRLKEVKRLKDFAQFNKNLPKKAFLVAYQNNWGNVAASCRIAHISRAIFYIWKKKDKKFLKALMEIEPEEHMLDMLEATLYQKAIVEKDTIAAIFLAKTKGKRRGYVERQELTGAGGGPLVFDVGFGKEE